MRKELAKSQEQYEIDKKMFFGLMFTDENLTVKVLESVEEFIQEEETHKHCVFSSNYYKKTNSLVFSARMDDKRLETVEVNLYPLRINQSRGLQNTPTEYHDQIVSLVDKNLGQIKKILKQKQA